MRPIIPLLFLASAVNAQIQGTLTIAIPPLGYNGECSATPVNQVSYNVTFPSPGIYGVVLMPYSQYQMLATEFKTFTDMPVNYYTQYSCIGSAGSGVQTCSTSTPPVLSTNETTCLICINTGTSAVTGTMSGKFGSGNESSAQPLSSAQPFSTAQPMSTGQPMSTVETIWIIVGIVAIVVIVGGVTVYFMKRQRQQNLNTGYNKPTLGAMESAPVWPESKADRIPPSTVPVWTESNVSRIPPPPLPDRPGSQEVRQVPIRTESDTNELDPGIVLAE